MRNMEIVGNFLRHEPAGVVPLSTDGTRLYSYGVVIAIWKGGKIQMPEVDKHYSRTTSRHRNYIRDAAAQKGVVVECTTANT